MWWGSLQRSLSTRRLVGAAVCGIYREDFPRIPESTLLPPAGQAEELGADQRLFTFLSWYGIHLTAVSVHIPHSDVDTLLVSFQRPQRWSAAQSHLHFPERRVLCILLYHSSLQHIKHSNKLIMEADTLYPLVLTERFISLWATKTNFHINNRGQLW